MNSTRKANKNQVKNSKLNTTQSTPAGVTADLKQAEQLENSLKAYTWQELETSGKFAKNDKLNFITEDTLVVGCDIGSETHYVRAVDFRGIELSSKAFKFSNDAAGFRDGKDYLIQLALKHGKKQIVLGLEPTGHYWLCMATWFIANGITVVQVNPFAVKTTKEVEDNSQLKDDRKDPKLIANLVKDGNYGMPYIPEGVYADIRELSLLRDQVNEDRIRYINRLHRELTIYFPEYKNALTRIDGKFTTELLKQVQLPCDMVEAGEDGIRSIWREAKLRGRAYGDVKNMLEFAASSIGRTEGKTAGRESIKWCAQMIQTTSEELDKLDVQIDELCMSIPHAENLLEINGVGSSTMTGILSQMGDISRFDNVKEVQKLSGLALVACSSGKHNGNTKISRRGRKRLRYWLFQAAKSAVHHADEFRQLHIYYTTRPKNPLKKMQSLIAIACKILRVIFTLLKTGRHYDPEQMLKDIKRVTANENTVVAA